MSALPPDWSAPHRPKVYPGVRATALANRDERAVHGRIVFHATVHEWSFVVEHLPNDALWRNEANDVLYRSATRYDTPEKAMAACDAEVTLMVLRGELVLSGA